MKTEIRQIQVERWSVKSSHPFERNRIAPNAALGHPNIKTLLRRAEAGSPAQMKAVLEKALGPSGFMEFIRLDPGKLVAKERTSSARIQRFVIGNPLVMKEMVKHVPDAASYAPVTILVVEEANSVRLSYDTMASLLAPYGNARGIGGCCRPGQENRIAPHRYRALNRVAAIIKGETRIVHKVSSVRFAYLVEEPPAGRPRRGPLPGHG